MWKLLQAAVLLLLVACAAAAIEATDIQLSRDELTGLYNEIPQEFKDLLYLPGISSGPPVYRPRKLKATPVVCTDTDTAICPYFAFYCNVRNATYKDVPLIIYCAGTCRYCQSLGLTSTTTTSAPNACLSNPCQNGGQCGSRSPDPGYDCACPAPWVGPNCEFLNTIPPTTTTTGASTTTVDSCRWDPCKNGALSCTNEGRSYTCACAPGFIGQNCQAADPCASNPCQNGGFCISSIDPLYFNTSYSCVCVDLSYGPTCSKTFVAADCFNQFPLYCDLTDANCSSLATIFKIPVREACTLKCIKTCVPTTTLTTSTVSTTRYTGPSTTTSTTTVTTTTLTTTTRLCQDLYGTRNCEVLKFYCNQGFTNITIGTSTYTIFQACQKTCRGCT